jgi:hypothetical protein
MLRTDLALRQELEARQRTVLDHEPSWLLLAVPLVVLASRAREAQVQDHTSKSPRRAQGAARRRVAGVPRLRRRERS